MSTLVLNNAQLGQNALGTLNFTWRNPETGYVMLSNGSAGIPITDYITIGNNATITLGASLTLLADPITDLGAATKHYADGVAGTLSSKPAVTAATTTTLPTYVYGNGTLGVGATLTATATGTLTIDGHLVALNDLIYVKNETGGGAPYNGLYTCTTAGAVGVLYVLTRNITMQTAMQFSGATIEVEAGTVNALTGWLNTNVGAVVVGTTNITSVQVSGPGTAYVGTYNGNTWTTGTGTLTLGAGKTTTFDHTSTFTTTDAQTYTFPITSATLARTDAANTFTGHQTIEGVTSTGATGTGTLVFSISPTFTGTAAFAAATYTGQITSTLVTGTAPFVVASTTAVANLTATTATTATNLTGGTVSATTLTASSTVTLSPANVAVTISPSGTGTVAINPAGALTISPTAASTMNNTSVGATTAATGRFTTANIITSESLNSVLLISATAPTIASGFGTTPTIPKSNGTAAFQINVGTGGTASSGVITMPAATTGWMVTITPNGAPQAAAEIFAVPTSTTQVTITNYTASTGVALAWNASQVLNCTAIAF
jgi:hypothetical protein